MLAAAARVPRAQLARFFSAVPTIKNVINGEFVESKTTKWVDIHNPGARALLANLLPRQSHSSVAATNELIARAPCTTQAEMQVALPSAPNPHGNVVQNCFAGSGGLRLGRVPIVAPSVPLGAPAHHVQVAPRAVASEVLFHVTLFQVPGSHPRAPGGAGGHHHQGAGQDPC